MKTHIPHEVLKLVPKGYVQIIGVSQYFDPSTGQWSSLESPSDTRIQTTYTWGVGKPAILIYQYDGTYKGEPYTDPSGNTEASTYQLNESLVNGQWVFGESSGPFYLFAQL